MASSAINMPDHAVRKRQWYQLFDRLWRPATGWVCCPTTIGYLFIVHPWLFKTWPPEGVLVIACGFAAGVYGFKTLEKVKGVA